MSIIHVFRKKPPALPKGLEDYIAKHYISGETELQSVTYIKVFESIQRENEEKKTISTASIKSEIDALADTSSFTPVKSFDHRIEEPVLSAFSPEASFSCKAVSPKMAPYSASPSLPDVRFRLDESFSSKLINILNEKNISNSQCYKKAHIDRRLFSKICCTPDYRPAKRTALALAVALELNLDETRDFIGAAGFSLSHSILFDVIVEFFISKGFYDIFEINEVLYAYDQCLLGQ